MLRHGGDGSVGRAAGGGDSSPVLQIEPLFVIGWLLPGDTTLGSSDVNLIQNKHNGLNFPYTKHLICKSLCNDCPLFQTGDMDS